MQLTVEKVDSSPKFEIKCQSQVGSTLKAFVTNPLEICENFKIQTERLSLDILATKSPGNLQNWVEIQGHEKADFDWHGCQEDWLALLQGSIRVEFIEIPELELDSVYEDILALKAANNSITLSSLRATKFRTYEELKKAGLTRVIELNSSPVFNMKTIPILVIPRGVFHASLTSESCTFLNLGKTFTPKSKYSNLDYETFAR